jgi:hypothetical protein
MLRRLSKDLISSISLVDQSLSLLRCGSPRKKRSRKKDAVRIDRPDTSSMHSLRPWESRTNIALRQFKHSSTSNTDKVDTRTTKEVVAVVAEAQIVVETTEVTPQVGDSPSPFLSPSQ